MKIQYNVIVLHSFKERGVPLNLFFRILLTIYAFCLTILSLITAMIFFKIPIFIKILDYLRSDILQDSKYSITMSIVSLVFFGISIVFLLSGVKTSKDKKAVSKYTNIGEIKISLNSIESIALAASRRLNGVRETKASVINIADTVSITIKAVVLPDINIPALSEDIQVKVKSSVEECSGVKVNDVRVIVDNIYTGYKARVE